jgi:hypothetical protein
VNKILRLVGIIILLLTGLMVLNTGPVMASDIKMSITITGLEQGEQATLTISHEGTVTAEEPLFVQTVRNNGEKSLTLNIGTSLKDGYYQLLLQAPDKYFRDPKGYFFMVYQSSVVNPIGHTIVFDLITPSAQTYIPYRESEKSVEASGDGIPYKVEVIRDLSAPEKQLQPSGGMILSQGYHYIGPMTTEDNVGVHGRFGVVNPDVVHNDTYNQFIVDRVMSYNDAANKWIEIGWAEVSWRGDTQYGYEYDTVDKTWNWFTLPGSTLEVKVEKYSGTTWRASYKNSGGTWTIAAEEDIGLSTAERAENRGEVYTLYTSPHPNLPSTTTDVSELKLDAYSWYGWTDIFDTYTPSYDDYPPYDTHYTYEYYNFYIHTHS